MDKAGAGAAYYPSAPGIPVAPPAAAPAGFQVEGGYPQRTQWSTGLFDCFDDASNCCITCCCPCITFGQIAEIVDTGNSSCGVHGALYGLLCSLTGFQCILSCIYRSKLRSQYGLPDSPCPDFLVHCCCESCALCQEYRELKSRGYDMDLGWQGNMDKFARNQTTPPLAHTGMTK